MIENDGVFITIRRATFSNNLSRENQQLADRPTNNEQITNLYWGSCSRSHKSSYHSRDYYRLLLYSPLTEVHFALGRMSRLPACLRFLSSFLGCLSVSPFFSSRLLFTQLATLLICYTLNI